ncbi:hypothetical protein ACIQC9_07655 [Brevundimonas sp. NPDC092305]|uniref:hypothetical protein n=1 Tax=Brevundimonas sp. NPDC092305 TaxID=3363957 RepID=UPI0037FF2377
MNAMKILQSVEELLYEVMSWLLFYPRTLLMTLQHPLRTMQYSDAEQRDKPEKQYLETLSPPLFLVLSILLAHGLELLFGVAMTNEPNVVSRFITASQQNLLAFRALMFSLHPLVFSWAFLKLSKHKIDRDSLRTPFFAQCYLSGATSILVSLGTLGVNDPAIWSTIAGIAIVVVTTVWYVAVQHLWLTFIPGMTQLRAWGWAVALYMFTTGLVIAANTLVE